MFDSKIKEPLKFIGEGSTGCCPSCRSRRLLFDDNHNCYHFNQGFFHRAFQCEGCGIEGFHIYRLDYLLSYIEPETVNKEG